MRVSQSLHDLDMNMPSPNLRKPTTTKINERFFKNWPGSFYLKIETQTPLPKDLPSQKRIGAYKLQTSVRPQGSKPVVQEFSQELGAIAVDSSDISTVKIKFAPVSQRANLNGLKESDVEYYLILGTELQQLEIIGRCGEFLFSDDAGQNTYQVKKIGKCESKTCEAAMNIGESLPAGSNLHLTVRARVANVLLQPYYQTLGYDIVPAGKRPAGSTDAQGHFRWILTLLMLLGVGVLFYIYYRNRVARSNRPSTASYSSSHVQFTQEDDSFIENSNPSHMELQLKTGDGTELKKRN
eukprot:TRINITY_DN10005_c0_g1_i1.p1 TRINITY_DN10005_c0_g1~~TRINITY_DN10005_c0_g1_i1.p1  ORF type:complete len:296 (+),score=31.17 TRINITY_DN10005_c0_g1_i1:149-1036(+)